MTIKKITVSLLAVSVLFTACGGGGSGDDDTGASTPDTTQTPPSSNEGSSISIKTPTVYDVVADKITYVSVLTGDDYIDTNNGQSFYTYEVTDKGSAVYAVFDASNYGNLRYVNGGASNVVKISITDSRTGKTVQQDLTFNIVEASAAEPLKVLKTGQADGDAGESREFSRSTTTPFGDVLDNVNGLTWSDTYGQFGYLIKGDKTFTEAKNQCINDGGRLPTVDELFTTLTYADGRYQGSKFDTNMLDDAFSAREAAYFWADNGKIINYTTGQLTAGEKARFRCIKSGQMAINKHIMYTEGDIVTHDLSTGLKWTTSDAKLTFAEAKNYCNNLDANTYGSGWQLPTINQLRSITNNGLIAGSILNGNPSLLSSTKVMAKGAPYHLFLLPTDGRSNYKVETAGETDVHAITCVKKDQ